MLAETLVSSWKRGATGYPGTVEVTIGDPPLPVDLTDPDWEVQWQARPNAQSDTVIPVDWDDSDAENGILVGVIHRADSERMRCGLWEVDIKVVRVSDNTATISLTYKVEVVPEISRDLV